MKQTQEEQRRKSILLELDGIDRSELLRLKTDLGADVDAIKGQLDRAKQKLHDTGERSSNDWFRRATSVLRMKGRQIQQVQAKLGELRIRRKKGLYQTFMTQAERLLPREDFKRILEAAVKDCEDSTSPGEEDQT